MRTTAHRLLSLSATAAAAIAACSGNGNTGSSTSDATTASASGAGGATSGAAQGGMTGAGGSSTTGTGGTGTGTGTGGTGSGGMTTGTGGAQAVLAYGDFNTDALNEIDRVAFPGAKKTKLALQGLGGDAIYAIALSPDGKQLAVAGRDTAMSNPVLNVYAADGSGAPKTLVTMPAPAQDFTSIAWSPNGKWIAFVGRFEVAMQNALYLVPSDGSATAKRVSQATMDTKLNVSTFAWALSADATHAYLAYVGDVVTDKVDSLWTYDAASATAMPVAIVPTNQLLDGQEVGTLFLGFDASARVYFKSNYQAMATFRIYSAKADGTGLAQAVGTKKSNGAGEASIGAFALSPDGKKIAFSADAPAQHLYQVFVGDAGVDNATVVSAVQATAPANGDRGPSFFSRWAWSPDQKLVVVDADWQVAMMGTDNAYSAFALPTSGAPGGVRIFKPAANTSQLLGAFGWSSDSKRLYAVGDLLTNNANELYSTTDFTTADQDPKGALAITVPSAQLDVNGIAVVP